MESFAGQFALQKKTDEDLSSLFLTITQSSVLEYDRCKETVQVLTNSIVGM